MCSFADYFNWSGSSRSDLDTLESTVACMRDSFLQSHVVNREYSGASCTGGTSELESTDRVSNSGVVIGDEAQLK